MARAILIEIMGKINPGAQVTQLSMPTMINAKEKRERKVARIYPEHVSKLLRNKQEIRPLMGKINRPVAQRTGKVMSLNNPRIKPAKEAIDSAALGCF